MIDLRELAPGSVLRLAGGETAEVIENPRDGLWVFVRCLSSPAGAARVGVEEPAFAESVVEVVSRGDGHRS